MNKQKHAQKKFKKEQQRLLRNRLHRQDSQDDLMDDEEDDDDEKVSDSDDEEDTENEEKGFLQKFAEKAQSAPNLPAHLIATSSYNQGNDLDSSESASLSVSTNRKC